MGDDFEYDSLPLAGGLPPRKQARRSCQNPRLLYSLGATTALAVLVFLCVNAFHWRDIAQQATAALPSFSSGAVSPPPRWTNCGSTPAEARSRGCKFDILSTAWQVPECYDEELMQQWLAVDKWKYFSDEDGEHEETYEWAMTGEHLIYFEERYHEHHCMFMWRQMHRAFTIRKYIDDHLDNYNHTLHCGHTMTEGRTEDQSAISTQGEIRYPNCRPVP